MAGDPSRSGASTPRPLAALAALLFASPLAFLFTSDRSAAPRTEVTAPAPSPTATAHPLDVQQPSAYCVDRFVRPVEELVGESPVQDAPDHHELEISGTIGHPDDVKIAVVRPAEPPGEQWLSRLGALRSELLRTPCMGIETMIATIADPTDSGLAYAYDTTLQALRLGLEHERSLGPNYLRDRMWLPWDDPEASEDPRRSAQCRDSMPGVVLFRGSDALKPRVLALFIVGETPTTGVHESAMVNALRAARAFASAPQGRQCEYELPDPCPGCVRIVGPTYSGSASSLRTALMHWVRTSGDAGTIEVVTGGANARRVPDILRNPDSPQPWLANPVTFLATTAPFESAECAYLSFLKQRLGVKPEEEEGTPSRPAAVSLSGVALLHESGTQYGASQALRCGLKPEIDVSFPVHVAALRTAYDKLDRKEEDRDPTIARRTSLDVSLKDKGRALESESNLSSVTTNAQDIALASSLESIAREGVRHVAIQATDVADAIFLARKIRDVAPDVRLAFFASDALLLHPTFRRDLLGSLVVTPYPFLGSEDFATRDDAMHSHLVFENDGAEGAFNAVLALRGLPAQQLREYVYAPRDSADAVLPTWISVIGRGGTTPLEMHRSLDCDRTIHGPTASTAPDAEERVLCRDSVLPASQDQQLHQDPVKAAVEERQNAWARFDAVPGATLKLDPDITPPRIWHLTYAIVVLLFLADRYWQRRARFALGREHLPDSFRPESDRAADIAIGRTKWEMYAWLRTSVFAVVLVYMDVVYAFAFVAYHTRWHFDGLRDQLLALGAGVLVLVAAIPTGFAVMGAFHCLRRFLADYARFGQIVGGWSLSVLIKNRREGKRLTPLPPDPREAEPSAWGRIWEVVSLSFGFAPPLDRKVSAQTSFNQLRFLFLVSGLLLALIVAALGWELFHDVRWPSGDGPIASPALTLFVLRALPLQNGVSPSTPLLLIAAVVYLWAVGRMQRLWQAHQLSRLSPGDGVADLVSTPMRWILYPGPPAPAELTDEGFTSVERATLNAIWRPSTGQAYVMSLVAILVVPVVLFLMKPPATLEDRIGCGLFRGCMVLCVLLIGATLVQLIQHWLALRLLLKRLVEHPLGQAFRTVQGFVRDSLEDQVSRTPNDLLRLAGCADQFDALVRSSEQFGSTGFAAAAMHDLRGKGTRLARARVEALQRQNGSALVEALDAESDLGVEVVGAARQVSTLLVSAWRGELTGHKPEPPTARNDDRRPDTDHDEVSDALSAVAWRFAPGELDWLRAAQSFVATVVALLVNRHVRQFRVFMYALTGGSLMLLAAVSSYPFEPHRLLLTFIWIIMGSVVVAGFWIYVELDQNTLLSFIAGTEPGRLTLDASLWFRVLTWVVLPLLSVAAAQYPEVANALFRVVEPFTRALK